MRDRLARRLGRFAGDVERVSLRFIDINGPKKGEDTVCRIKVVLSGRPSLLVEARATGPAEAFARALPALAQAMRRDQGRSGRSVRSTADARGAEKRSSEQNRPRADEGSLIGRRVGRSSTNLEAALDRPEKRRRDAFVDTAQVGVSADDRRAGYGATAARNTQRDPQRATATLEDSRTKPSRKNTRRSANRQKSATPIERQQRIAVQAPSERARRAAARGKTEH